MHEHAPWHPGKDHAGQCLDWMPTDTEESFNRMMQDPVHRAYFVEQGWDTPGAITYKINREGFRCDEFEQDQSCMMALGCSYTMGIGLPVETLWHNKLGKTLSLKVYNFGWGGISADTCYRLARFWMPILKPKLVAVLMPPRTRIELLMANGYHPSAEVFMPASQSKFFSEHDMFLKHWWLNDENGVINSEKNNLALQQLANMHGAKFVSLKADEEMAKSREEVGYARDYMHAGPRGHELVADKMLKELAWP